MAKGRSPARLNIYLPDPSFRRRIKSVVARGDLSLSDYCVRAITAQLDRDEEGGREEKAAGGALADAIRRARRFQSRELGGKIFRVRSSDLIEKARAERKESASPRGNRRR
jgi:hypothetical protein